MRELISSTGVLRESESVSECSAIGAVSLIDSDSVAGTSVDEDEKSPEWLKCDDKTNSVDSGSDAERVYGCVDFSEIEAEKVAESPKGVETVKPVD
jgi:hypothetical protein